MMIANWIRNAFLRKLGTCGYCMRMNLRGALVGWAITVAAASFGFNYWYLILPWPVAFTALWALHVTTYAGRSMNAISRTRRAGLNTARVTRRLIFIHGMRATALVILSSMAIPEIAAAQDPPPPPPPPDSGPAHPGACRDHPCLPIGTAGDKYPFCTCSENYGNPYGCIYCPPDARWFVLAKQNIDEDPSSGCYQSREDCEDDDNPPDDCIACDEQHV
jgi:hypothetical protein